MPTLFTVVASTRPNRIGLPIAKWFHALADSEGSFTPEMVDLLEVNLPPLDEPNHPRFRKYEHAHTKAWSERVSRADAFVFVTPEYNYFAPPALINAIDYLFHEWSYKPVAFVSYGGVSGGTRSVQALKQIVTSLRMMPLPEAVTIPFAAKKVDAGAFKAEEIDDKAARDVLRELRRWSDALAVLRTPT